MVGTGGLDSGCGGAHACLARLLGRARIEERREAARQISALLARDLCENQLRDLLLYERGCCGAFEVGGFDASGWLAHLRSRLFSS